MSFKYVNYHSFCKLEEGGAYVPYVCPPVPVLCNQQKFSRLEAKALKSFRIFRKTGKKQNAIHILSSERNNCDVKESNDFSVIFYYLRIIFVSFCVFLRISCYILIIINPRLWQAFFVFPDSTVHVPCRKLLKSRTNSIDLMI